jgi:hypothetical protein
MKYEKGTFITIPNKLILKGKPAAFQSIFMWINEHANDVGECFPSRKLISEEAGVDIKTLDKYMKDMVDIGLIIKITRKINGSYENTTNLYQVMILEGVAPKTVLGGTENGVTGGTENGALTQSITNSIHLTPIKVSSKKLAEGEDSDGAAEFRSETILEHLQCHALVKDVKQWVGSIGDEAAQDVDGFYSKSPAQLCRDDSEKEWGVDSEGTPVKPRKKSAAKYPNAKEVFKMFPSYKPHWNLNCLLYTSPSPRD